MSKMYKFPSIGHLRNVVQSLTMHYQYAGKDEEDRPIYDADKPLPIIHFEGKVKLHGTNAGIVFDGDEVYFQSRTSVITPLNDNAGFATAYSGADRIAALKNLRDLVRDTYNIPDEHPLVFFGEWIGKGIQKGVAVSELPRSFVLFGIKEIIDDENRVWHPVLRSFEDFSINFYNIDYAGRYELDLNLRHPDAALEKIDKLVAEVEECCPFAKLFDVEGLGEGIVWTATLEDGSQARFKSKGEKHSVVKSKSKKTTLDPEVVNSINEFVEYAVPDARLEQGYNELFETKDINPDRSNTGDFIRWVLADVGKEEVDTLSSNNLTLEMVKGKVSERARIWFFTKLDKAVFG